MNPDDAKRPPLERMPALTVSLVVLAGAGIACVARLPTFPIEFVYAFGVSALLRLSIGRRGERLAPRSILQGVGAVLLVAGAMWLFQRRGMAVFVGILAIVAAMQTLFLLGRFARSGVYSVVLTSTLLAVGTALLAKDVGTLVLTVLYTVLLFWTLLLVERRDAVARQGVGLRDIRRVRFTGRDVLPARAALRALAAIVLIGFPLGLAAFFVVPRWGAAAQPSTTLDGSSSGKDAQDRSPFDRRREFAESRAITGMPQDTGFVEFGSVGKIKESQLPVLQVFRPDGRRPRGVYLRDNIMDEYLPSGRLRASAALKAVQTLLRPDAEGWFNVEPTPRVLPQWRDQEETLLIQTLQTGFGRWFLMPWPKRARLLRGRTPTVVPCQIRKNGYHTLALHLPGVRHPVFRRYDVIEVEYVSQRRSDAELSGYTSQPEVRLLSTYTNLPPGAADVLAPVARVIVGDEVDPWKRARKLEAWLKQPPFEYALEIPALDPDERIVDFIMNVKRGNCELYAMSLMALLRTFGHPARYVRGFWGGDALGDPADDEGSIVMRNSHYHAWVEIYLNEIGWVALNPTPPDRRPVDADDQEHAEDPTAIDGADTARDELDDAAILEFGSEEYDEFWSAVGETAGAATAETVGFLFSRRSAYLGYVVLGGLLVCSVFLSRRRTLRDNARAAGGRIPKGPYGKALVLLAKQGVRRPAAQTPRELYVGVRDQIPVAAPPLRRLTDLFERARYGGADGVADGPDAKTALRDLAQALATSRRG